jgi:hypothetical protein
MLKLISKNEKNTVLKLFNIFKKNDNLSHLKTPNKQLSINLFYTKSVILTGLIIKIIFNKSSNVFIYITNFFKNITSFCSIKPTLKTKLLKLKNEEIYKILYQIMSRNKKYLKQNNITLQIINNNDLNFAYYFIEQVLNNFNLTKIQFFKNYSFNGCRKKRNG